MMHADKYQAAARRTVAFPMDRALEYLALGLASEAGEVAGKVKKVIRDNQGTLGEQQIESLIDELGDVQWYLAMLSRELLVPLSEVMVRNLEKLESRAQRGRIQGSGDNR